MAKYVLLLPSESTWQRRSPQDRERGYAAHNEFTRQLAAGGHTMTGGAELTQSREATTLTQVEGDVLVTNGPFAEVTEQVAGFYLVETEDLAGLVEVCKGLARVENIEIRPVLERGDSGTEAGA